MRPALGVGSPAESIAPTRRAALALAAACAMLSACATAPQVIEPTGTPLEPGIYRVEGGQRLDKADFFDALSGSRLIYIGESHDNATHHRIQAEILEGLARRSPGRVALGMEMFQRPFQPALDAFVAGKLDEAGLLSASEYTTRWGHDFAFYRPLLELMRLQGSPVLALNAPGELTKRLSKEGLEGLDEAERAMLLESFGADNPAHRAMIQEALGSSHGGMDEATFARFYRVQVAWDAVMGATAADFLASRPDIAHVVVVAGMFHVQRGLGIAFHAQRRGAEGGVIVIPIALGDEAVFAEDVVGSGVGDFVWVERVEGQGAP